MGLRTVAVQARRGRGHQKNIGEAGVMASHTRCPRGRVTDFAAHRAGPVPRRDDGSPEQWNITTLADVYDTVSFDLLRRAAQRCRGLLCAGAAAADPATTMSSDAKSGVLLTT